MATSASTLGSIKVNFLSAGTYIIDGVNVTDDPVTNWYVSPDGSDDLTDGNGQSPENPLKTI